jgi:prevent-host-death family protein
MPEEVGIRELRQNLSAYLRRIKDGERFVVTERGTPVATIGPAPADEDPYEAMIASGEITPGTGDLLDLPPLPPYDPDDPHPGTRILEEQREDRLP